jgi:DNA-binding transcriptional regulator WhiA
MIDLEHIEKFKTFLNYSGNIETKKPAKISHQNFFYIRVSLYQNTIFDLEHNFNIVEKKSLLLQPPNIVDTELIKAFIIGYIDGDGSIFQKTDRNYKYVVLSICGTQEMLTWMYDFFNKEYFKRESKLPKPNLKSKIGKNTWEYIITGRKALIILNDFRLINTTKLCRKWNNF